MTNDELEVADEKTKCVISKCTYVDMFESYGIMWCCRVFCETDMVAYAHLRCYAYSLSDIRISRMDALVTTSL